MEIIIGQIRVLRVRQGYLGVDCDDTDADINPGETETENNVVDEDCDDLLNDGNSKSAALPFDFATVDQVIQEQSTTSAMIATESSGRLHAEMYQTTNKHAGVTYELSTPIDLTIASNKTFTCDFYKHETTNPGRNIDIRFWNSADGAGDPTKIYVHQYTPSANDTWDTGQTFTLATSWGGTSGSIDYSTTQTPTVTSVDRITFYFDKGYSDNAAIGDYFEIDNLNVVGGLAGINDYDISGAELVSEKYYNLLGQEIDRSNVSGVLVVKQLYSNGVIISRKVIR